MLDAVICRNHKVAALADTKLAHNSEVSAAQYVDDFALCAPFIRHSRDVNQRSIAVHPFGRFARRKKDIALHAVERLIGYQKSESVAVHRKPSGYIFGIRSYRDEMTRAQLDELAFFHQAVERVFERIAIFALQVQFTYKLFECSARMRELADVLEDTRITEAGRCLRMFPHYPQLWNAADILTLMELKAIRLTIPENGNIIVGQSHFIKTVEDIYEAIVNTSPHIQFGVAFNEASGDCLIRFDGNDDALKQNAIANAQAIGAGHVFVVALRNGFPINILNRIREVPEVANIYCATANPVEVIAAETEQGRGVLGVVDGSPPKGVETEVHVKARVELLQKFGYKR